jgi:methyl halide transferase
MMPTLDAAYWNSRYLNDDAAWDAGAITTPIKAYFDGLTNKNLSILIPGAGNAYEAEYLVKQGFTDVTVCDIAPAALENLQRRCPSMKPEQLLLADFFKLKGPAYDLIIEQTFFCALDPSLRPRYFRKMTELLKPGGRLAGVLFDDKLNSDKPPFGGNREEYLNYILPTLRVITLEKCRNSIAPRAGRELFMELHRA